MHSKVQSQAPSARLRPLEHGVRPGARSHGAARAVYAPPPAYRADLADGSRVPELLVQRKCACDSGGPCNACGDGMLQRHAAPASDGPIAPPTPNALINQVIARSGHALDPATRTMMEQTEAKNAAVKLNQASASAMGTR